jgi:hypothetical protein
MVSTKSGGVMDSQEQLGKLTPAQGDDGTVTTYECCGSAGRKARFSAKSRFLSSKSVSPDDVPDGLSWSRRFV